jgi:hypothetical protein
MGIPSGKRKYPSLVAWASCNTCGLVEDRGHGSISYRVQLGTIHNYSLIRSKVRHTEDSGDKCHTYDGFNYSRLFIMTLCDLRRINRSDVGICCMRYGV